MSKRIHFLLKACPKNKDISKAITVKEYAKKHHLSLMGVRDRIASHKLQGFKSKGKWWVFPAPF